jgi:alpha-1,2-mannosyltransferase
MASAGAAGLLTRVSDRGLTSRGVSRAVAAAGAVAALLFLRAVVLDPRGILPLFDLTAYQVGGQRVLGGVSLYDSPLLGATRGVFEFVYPPFAALLFVPLAPLHGAVFVAVAVVVGVGLLAGVVWLSLIGLGLIGPGRASASLGLGLTGLLLWCEPILETVAFGQINLLVLVLVLADVLRPDSARSKGALIGLAAGIKLTPLFFVLYLLVTRRFRAASVAGAAFLATVLVGAVVLPGDSRTFWAGAFADPSRVGVPRHPGNQSLRGLIARAWGSGTGEQLLWFASAVLVALVGLWLAARLASCGQELAAAVVCGVTATAVSPFSWAHHWVWFAPLLILLLDRALRRGTAAAWLAWAGVAVMGAHGYFTLFGLLPAPLDAPVGNLPTIVYQHGYVVMTAVLLAVLARRAVTGVPPRF